MSYRMFVDDVRHPSSKYPKEENREEWVVARTVKDAISYMEGHGCPSEISFDHDLGCDESGEGTSTAMEIIHWMIEMDMDSREDKRSFFIPDNIVVHYHSANPVGRENMKDLFDGYLKSRRGYEIARDAFTPRRSSSS